MLSYAYHHSIPMHIIIQFLCCWVDKGIQPEHI